MVFQKKCSVTLNAQIENNLLNKNLLRKNFDTFYDAIECNKIIKKLTNNNKNIYTKIPGENFSIINFSESCFNSNNCFDYSYQNYSNLNSKLHYIIPSNYFTDSNKNFINENCLKTDLVRLKHSSVSFETTRCFSKSTLSQKENLIKKNNSNCTEPISEMVIF